MFTYRTTGLETILSRVQRCYSIPLDVVVERLQLICELEGYTVEDGGLRLIARAGEGSMRDSQSLLDQVFSFGETTITTAQVAAALGLIDRGLLYQMLRGLVHQDAELCLDSIEQVYRYGYDLSEFSAELLEILRNATVAVLSPKTRRFLDIPEDEQETLIALQSRARPMSSRALFGSSQCANKLPLPRPTRPRDGGGSFGGIRAAVRCNAGQITRLSGGRQIDRRQQAQQRGQGVASDDGGDPALIRAQHSSWRTPESLSTWRSGGAQNREAKGLQSRR